MKSFSLSLTTVHSRTTVTIELATVVPSDRAHTSRESLTTILPPPMALPIVSGKKSWACVRIPVES